MVLGSDTGFWGVVMRFLNLRMSPWRRSVKAAVELEKERLIFWVTLEVEEYGRLRCTID